MGIGLLTDVVPDEFYYCIRYARTRQEALVKRQAAIFEMEKFNISSDNYNDQIAVTCIYWRDGTHWIVKADIFGQSHRAIAFGLLW